MEHICHYEIPIVGYKDDGHPIYDFTKRCTVCGEHRNTFECTDKQPAGLCSTCRGRGEVSSGVFWVDEYGNVCGAVNPKAKSKTGIVWVVQENPLSELYSIAVCQECRGCGLDLRR